MTDETIIRLAHEAGFTEHQMNAITCESGPYDITGPSWPLKRFVSLVIAESKMQAGVAERSKEAQS